MKTVASVACLKLLGGRLEKAATRVVVEKELPVFINGEHLITASIIPELEKEFVAGYLFGQGFIENMTELESIDIEGNSANVTVKDAGKIAVRAENASYRIVSGGGKLAFTEDTVLPVVQSRLKVGKKEIFNAMNTIFERAAIYRETEGTHAAGLFTPEAEAVCVVEDIGRHNTLDKVIGYGLLHKIDFSSVFLASTGRMASEMVAKLGRAGIPVAATKTAVTADGLEIARKCGLTVIGFVRDTGTRIHTDMDVRIIKEAGMKIYTNPERIIL